MDPNTFPTKGNLILAKNSLALSRQGFELMDKKRNILIREMMELIRSDFPHCLRSSPESQHGDRHCFCTADRLYCPGGKLHPDQNPQRHGNGDPSCGI